MRQVENLQTAPRIRHKGVPVRDCQTRRITRHGALMHFPMAVHRHDLHPIGAGGDKRIRGPQGHPIGARQGPSLLEHRRLGALHVEHFERSRHHVGLLPMHGDCRGRRGRGPALQQAWLLRGVHLDDGHTPVETRQVDHTGADGNIDNAPLHLHFSKPARLQRGGEIEDIQDPLLRADIGIRRGNGNIGGHTR